MSYPFYPNYYNELIPSKHAAVDELIGLWGQRWEIISSHCTREITASCFAADRVFFSSRTLCFCVFETHLLFLATTFEISHRIQILHTADLVLNAEINCS